MSVEINIPHLFQPVTEKAETVGVRGDTVGDCLGELVKRFPELKSKLFSRSGKLHSFLEVYVNGESAFPDELSRPVSDGDKLQILNIIIGG